MFWANTTLHIREPQRWWWRELMIVTASAGKWWQKVAGVLKRAVDTRRKFAGQGNISAKVFAPSFRLWLTRISTLSLLRCRCCNIDDVGRMTESSRSVKSTQSCSTSSPVKLFRVSRSYFKEHGLQFFLFYSGLKTSPHCYAACCSQQPCCEWAHGKEGNVILEKQLVFEMFQWNSASKKEVR